MADHRRRAGARALELVSAGIAVRTRRETGRTFAATLVDEIVEQHAARLSDLAREQVEAERSALRHVAAGS